MISACVPLKGHYVEELLPCISLGLGAQRTAEQLSLEELLGGSPAPTPTNAQMTS